MALIKDGYWQDTYWASRYWQEDYWPEYGYVPPVAPTPEVVSPAGMRFHRRRKRVSDRERLLLMVYDYLEMKTVGREEAD